MCITLGDDWQSLDETQRVEELAQSEYSPNVVAFLQQLLDGRLSDVKALSKALSEASFEEIERASLTQDYFFQELSKEAENGRIARLLIKMEFVLEQYRTDDSGEFYLIQLFHEFVFRQVCYCLVAWLFFCS